MKLIDYSNEESSFILTTKKDWVRLPEEARLMINFLDCKIKFQSIIQLENNLSKIIEIKK